jgi:uncharacterized protein with HEPN domain
VGHAAFSRDAVRISSRYTYDTWIVNDEALYALQHVVQDIGEAASRTTDDLRKAHPQIPWFDIIGMRHIIVHHYEDLNLDKLWNAATVHAAALILELEAILPPLSPEEPDDLNP